MTKTLYKNLISFILMCAIVVSCCVALLAVTDSFNDGIMGASLTATKHWYGDEIYARTSDQIDTHTCTQDGDGSDYSTVLRVFVVYKTTYLGEDDILSEGVREHDTNLVEVEIQPGFGKDLYHVSSEHWATLACESESSHCYFSLDVE